jgi:hypothetical protein
LDLDYSSISGLSNEVRQKLAQVKPENIGQAGRISGVTPAAVSLLLVHLKRKGGLTKRAAGHLSLETELADGLQAFAAQQQMRPSFSLDVFAVEDAFLNYLRLLQHWNKAFNLTAIRDDRGQVIRHSAGLARYSALRFRGSNH